MRRYHWTQLNLNTDGQQIRVANIGFAFPRGVDQQQQKDIGETEALHRNDDNQLLDREEEQKFNCCRATSTHPRVVGASTNGLRFGDIGAGLRGSSGR